MRFSAKGEYGVRVMVDLARHYGAGPLSLAEIAEQERLPLAYLEQIIADLRAAGLVTSRRGRHGGYMLTRPPAAITMGEVVRLLEGGISPMVCIPDDPRADEQLICVHQDYCTTRVLWLRVRDSIIEVLETTTLADLVPGAAVPASGARLPLPLHGGPALLECHELVMAEKKATTRATEVS